MNVINISPSSLPASPHNLTGRNRSNVSECKILYLNYTAKPIHLFSRASRSFRTIHPLPYIGNKDHKGQFVIVYEEHGLPADRPTYSSDVDVLHHSVRGGDLSDKCSEVAYAVDPSEFTGDSIINLIDMGLIISFKEPLRTSDVFKDTSNTLRDDYNNVRLVDLNTQDTFRLDIVLIDNETAGQVYFVNIDNRVYKIVSQEHAEMSDGVHILNTRNQVEGDGTKFFQIQDCVFRGDNDYDKPILLFTNKQEALHKGSKERLIAAENEKLVKEKEKWEHDINELKHQVLMAKEHSALRKEKADANADGRKDYYESRSYERRDTSEGLSSFGKVIAACTSIVLAGFGLVKLLL